MTDESFDNEINEVDTITNIDSEDEPTTRSLNYYRIPVFGLAFFSYGLYHASRKTLSNVKETLEQEYTSQSILSNQTEFRGLHPTKNWISDPLFHTKDEATSFFGDLDAVFMAFYAVGLYACGWLTDRTDPRYILSFGMILSGITLFLFGCLPHYIPQLLHEWYLIIIYALFGLFQASGWPAEVTIVSNWIGPARRGFGLGLYASCQSVGNIIGSYGLSFIVPLGSDICFLVMSAMMIAGGCIIFFGMISHPSQIGMEIYQFSTTTTNRGTQIENGESSAMPFWKAVLLPGVIAYALSMACLKLVNYGFFFWLPLYLHDVNGWDNVLSDKLSVWYDVGAVIGSFTSGYLTDLLGYRSPVIVPMIFVSLGALYGFSVIPSSIPLNAFVLTIVGVLIGGSYNLVVGTVATDLGRTPELAGNSQALSTVTGVIDGTGSVGSAIGQVFIPMIKEAYGARSIFYLFIVMNFLSVVCLGRVFHREMKLLVQRFSNSDISTLDDEYAPLVPT